MDLPTVIWGVVPLVPTLVSLWWRSLVLCLGVGHHKCQVTPRWIVLPSILLNSAKLTQAFSIHRIDVGFLTQQQSMPRAHTARIATQGWDSPALSISLSNEPVWSTKQGSNCVYNCVCVCASLCLLSSPPKSWAQIYPYTRATGRLYWWCLYNPARWQGKNGLSRRTLVMCKDPKLLFILVP